MGVDINVGGDVCEWFDDSDVGVFMCLCLLLMVVMVGYCYRSWRCGSGVI